MSLGGGAESEGQTALHVVSFFGFGTWGGDRVLAFALANAVCVGVRGAPESFPVLVGPAAARRFAWFCLANLGYFSSGSSMISLHKL